MPKPKKGVKVTVVQSDDWDGLFIDGKLVFEGHQIPYWEILKALTDKTLASWEGETANYGWLSTRGCYPKNLKEVKFDG